MSRPNRHTHIVLFATVAFLATSVLPSAGLAQSDAQQPPATAPKKETRKSPRALMRIFLLAAKDLDKATPEQIDEVLSCLDLTELEEDVRRDQGIRLVQKLEAVIDSLGITLDTIPDDAEGEDFEFHEAEDGLIGIVLEREPDTGLWRFAAATVKNIADLHAAVQKEKAEAKKQAAESEEEQQVDVKFRSARATMETFLTAMNDDPPNLADAQACLDLSEIPPAVRTETGPELATTLLFCMNRIKEVVYQEISEKPDENSPLIWKSHEKGQIAFHRIEDGELKGQWLFTPGTLNTIKALSDTLEDAPLAEGLQDKASMSVPYRLRVRQWLPDWLEEESVLLEHWQWLGLLGLVLIGLLLDRIVVTLLGILIGRQVDKQVVKLARGYRRSTVRPLGLIVLAAVWWWGLRLFDLPDAVLQWLFAGVKFFAAAAGVWAFYRLADLLGGYLLARAAKTQNKFDDLLVPLIRKTLKVAITVFGIVFIAKTLDYDLTELLVGLSIGGLALAFAAKETLSNIFGSLAILLDRPFQIGDSVIIGDHQGTVEDVGFRSTRIRTFYDSVVTIPNADCVNMAIDNMGRRRARRFKTVISVTYSTTPEQLEAFCEGIRELIRQHPMMQKDNFKVYANEFAASSIDIMLYCFFATTDWGISLRERHGLILDIMRLAEKLHVEFAFPTQTVHLIQSDSEQGARLPVEPGDVERARGLGRDEAARIAKDSPRGGADEPPPVSI